MKKTLFLLILLVVFCPLYPCGIVLVRLKKAHCHYTEKYQDPSWGARKACLLMEIQRNRGQDGAGLAVAKCANCSMECARYVGRNALEKVFETAANFSGDIYLGHVRYATYGADTEACCQPHVYKNTLALAGNFNLTNTNQILSSESDSDIDVIMQQFSSQLEMDPVSIIRQATKEWDGGYTFAGILGNGDTFVFRDPAGIRPGFFYEDEEVFAVASERVALASVFKCELEKVKPIKPGFVMRIQQNGTVQEEPFAKPVLKQECVFERIYFSQCYDGEIYRERKALGKNLALRVLEELNYDLDNTLFTFIPNSSETAYLGLTEELFHLTGKKVRMEKLIHKNQKLRTFIANDASRKNLVSQLYAITKGIVLPTDTIVAIDDSIVRGTTLRESILPKLMELNPKKIIFVSSAPPIMYPDCYGIDMSQISRFVAFQAAVELHKDKGNEA